jgi:hypothetical protein
MSEERSAPRGPVQYDYPAIEELGERIAEQAAHLDAATHRLLSDIRAFDDQAGWAHQGARTCAQWLSWRLGWSHGTAREHVRVATKLAELPLIDDALRRGEISYCRRARSRGSPRPARSPRSSSTRATAPARSSNRSAANGRRCCDTMMTPGPRTTTTAGTCAITTQPTAW